MSGLVQGIQKAVRTAVPHNCPQSQACEAPTSMPGGCQSCQYNHPGDASQQKEREGKSCFDPTSFPACITACVTAGHGGK